MSVNIIDNFQFGSNLPLDNRYIVGNINDVSLYWYPGMQLYQTSDQQIWFADNSLNWDIVKPDTSGFVPYIGATNDVNLGTRDLSAGTITGQQLVSEDAVIAQGAGHFGSVYVDDEDEFTIWQLGLLCGDASLSGYRKLEFTVGDTNREITLQGDPTLDDWFDQSVKTSATPTFAGMYSNGNIIFQGARTLTTNLSGSNGNNLNIIPASGLSTGVGGDLILASGDAFNSASGLAGNVTIESGNANQGGDISLKTNGGPALSGDVSISTGSASGGSGNIELTTGSGFSVGKINLITSAGGYSGEINLKCLPGGLGGLGNITLTPGTSGQVIFDGNINVKEGVINFDPTYTNSSPIFGDFWCDSSTLFFNNGISSIDLTDNFSQLYIDGSLALRDASISYLYDNKQDNLTGSISGTINQVIVSSNSNSIAQDVSLSLPQDIATTSTPTFAGMYSNGNIIFQGARTLTTNLSGSNGNNLTVKPADGISIGTGGDLILSGGDGASGFGGDLTIQSGGGAGNPGNLILKGQAGGFGTYSGDVSIYTENSGAGSGNIEIKTGTGYNNGKIDLITGGGSYVCGDINLTCYTCPGGGGDITLTPSTTAQIILDGNINIKEGVINFDPSINTSPVFGDFWSDSSTLYFNNGVSSIDLTDKVSKSYIDGSLALRDASINDLNILTQVHEASIGQNTSDINDVSLNSVTRSEWYQNGFWNADDVSISFDDGSRTLTIQPSIPSGDYVYYTLGNKSTITDSNASQLADTEGLHVFYYMNDGSIGVTLNPSHEEVDNIIEKTAIIAYVQWDASNNVGRMLYEVHGAKMSPATHRWLHDNIGAIYREGMSPGNMSVDGDGDSDADAQFSLTAGGFYDEDIHLELEAVGQTIGNEIWYLDGDNWRWKTNTGFSVISYNDVSSNRLAWNENGAQTQVDNNDFVLCHIFATNITDQERSKCKFIAIQGQGEYNTLVAARAGADEEINNLTYGTLPLQEVIPVATFIFQSGNYTGIKARIRSTESGDNFVDWRSSNLKASGGVVTDHGSLSGLEDNDHPQYGLVVDIDSSLSGLTLGYLSDVSVAAATMDQVLTWKGTYWEPNDISSGLLSATSGKLQLIDSSGGQNINNIIATPLTWSQQDFYDTSTFKHVIGDSSIAVLKTGLYELSFNINAHCGNNFTTSGIQFRNNSTTIGPTLTSGHGLNIANNHINNSLSPYLINLTANDILDIIAFRLGDATDASTSEGNSFMKINYLG